MEISSSRYRWLLGAFFALALVVRLAVTARFQGLGSPPDETGYPDQVVYDNLAYRLSQGLGYVDADGHPTAFRTPGTSLTLLPVYLVLGRNYTALRVWVCLLSAATVLALAWFTRRAFGSLAALCAAAILALDPGHFYYAQHFVSEVPYCLLATLAAGTAWCAFTASAEGRPSRRWDVATGILAALATLARPQFVFVVALTLAGGILAKERRRLWPRVALQTSVFLACLAPWIVRNAVQLGSPTLSTLSGCLFFGVHNEVIANSPLRGTWMRPDSLTTSDWPTDEVAYDRRCWQAGLEFVRTRPELLPGLVYHKFRRLVSPIAGTDNALLRRTWALGWLVTAPLFLAGWVLAWKRDRRTFWIVSAHFGGLALMTLVFCGTVRYRHTVNPPIASLAGVSVAAGIELVRRSRRTAPAGLTARVE
jgi:4-amino-4-deoxy-L-arabinose transferase-like glycosyltransferase